MEKSTNLSFSLKINFNSNYHVDRYGTKITKVKVTFSHEVLILWESTAVCKITKKGEVIWDFKNDRPFSLICKIYAKKIYTDEDVKEIFNTMKERKSLN